MPNVKCELGNVNCAFCIEACHCHHHRSFLDAILQPFGRLLESLGRQLDLSWNHLKAARATLGVFWTISGRLQIEDMIWGVNINHFGGRLEIQNQ